MQTTVRLQPRGPRAGGVLVIALIAVFVVSAMATVYLNFVSIVSRRQAKAVETNQAFYAAEAGLAEAYTGLMIGKTGAVGSENEPARFGNGIFWVESTSRADGTIRLESTGMVATGRATLALVAEPGEEPVASLGFFSKETFEVGPGVMIDGYDSREGNYDQLHAEDKNSITAGQVGSGADIEVTGTVESPTVVLGDLTTGVDGELRVGNEVVRRPATREEPAIIVQTDAEVYVAGTVEQATEETALPSVNVPNLVPREGVRHETGVPRFILPGETALEFLEVADGAEVVIQGPSVVVVGNLEAESGGKLTFDTSHGEIELCVTEGVDLQEGSWLECSSQETDQISVQVAGETDEPVRIGSSGSFAGVIYAPEAEVEMTGDIEYYGALIGAQLRLSGGVRMHFDRYLTALSAEGVLPTLLSWRILDLGNAASRSESQAQFQLLGASVGGLPIAADAHQDQLLAISYKDALSIPRNYNGQESTFDWNNVTEVVSLSRDGVDVHKRLAGIAIPIPFETRETLVDLVDQLPALTSAELRAALLATSPLPDLVLLAAINRGTPMDSADLEDVLALNTPLSDAVLGDLIQNHVALTDTDLEALLQLQAPTAPLLLADLVDVVPPVQIADVESVLVSNLPLPGNVLDSVIDRAVDPFSSNQLMSLLRDSSLPADVLQRVVDGDAAMSVGDRQTVLTANGL